MDLQIINKDKSLKRGIYMEISSRKICGRHNNNSARFKEHALTMQLLPKAISPELVIANINLYSERKIYKEIYRESNINNSD